MDADRVGLRGCGNGTAVAGDLSVVKASPPPLRSGPIWVTILSPCQGTRNGNARSLSLGSPGNIVHVPHPCPVGPPIPQPGWQPAFWKL